jgi:hypothetical protein
MVMLTTQSLSGGAPVAPGRLSSEPIHRHVRRRVCGHRRAGPVGVAALELEAPQFAHQIGLRRPDVAVVPEREMVRGQELVDDVVGIDADVAPPAASSASRRTIGSSTSGENMPVPGVS